MTDTLESLREEIRWLRSELGQLEDLQLITELRQNFGIPVGAARVLEALYRAKGRTVDNDRLLQMINSEGDRRLIAVRICQIRSILGRDAVETIWHCGSRLGEPGRRAIELAKKSLTSNLAKQATLRKAG